MLNFPFIYIYFFNLNIIYTYDLYLYGIIITKQGRQKKKKSHILF